MENSEIANNENKSINEIPMENQNEIQNDLNNIDKSLDNKPIEVNTINLEASIDNQKPPTIEEKKEEIPSVNDITSNTLSNTLPSTEETKIQNNPTNNIHAEPTSNAQENPTAIPEVATTTPPKTPELTTRKSSKNLSKEEKLRRQRELRKKKILASSQERLSRITKTYSQGSSYYDSSDRDESSLSRKSSSRSIHNHYTLERSPSINSNKNIIAQSNEQNNTQTTNEQNTNINDLSRNNSINSINSLKNNDDTISKDVKDVENDNSGNSENDQKNNEIDVSPVNNNNVSNDLNNNNTNSENNDTKAENNNTDFARLLFREMLKEEFNKSNNINGQNIGPNQDFKNGMDTLLTADKPFEALGKMFDFLNVDEKTTEEQRIADEKYKQYCKICKLIHTALTLVFSLLVVLVSIRAVHVIEDNEYNKRNFIGDFFYRLSNSDTLSQGKTLFGMTPWSCFILLEITLLAGQLGYQYVFNIKKETWKEFDLIPIPAVNKFISLANQYKLYFEVLVNDLFLYLFIIGISVSVGKIFY